MRKLTLEIDSMAHGGVAVGRDEDGRPVFVPYAISGERVRVNVLTQKKSYARAELIEVLEASPNRIRPRCPHFSDCGGCHFQHMDYESQLRAKADVVRDQLKRIGGLTEARVLPTLANPSPWAYRVDVSLSPTSGGDLGFWSPRKREVIPIDTCHIIHPSLLALWQDIELTLPGLRKLTLRMGKDGALLAALEVEGVEPPQLTVDFPVSVAIVLPDKRAASLIGDSYLVQLVKGREFRVSPGSFFQPSPAAVALLIDTVLNYAALTGAETVADIYCGVGTLTAFLSEKSRQIVGIDMNPDAIADAVVNLGDHDHVSLYQGRAEDILPLLDLAPDVVVVNPPAKGLSAAIFDWLSSRRPERIIYAGSDVAKVARDGKQLGRIGYELVELQPIDMAPQTFQVETVSLWKLAS
jgi:23S rRNA (uracil1939-C5)-methyltransferase